MQIYAPTYDRRDEEIDRFYRELAKAINNIPKKDIVQGDWNAKVGEDAYCNWRGMLENVDSVKEMREVFVSWSSLDCIILSWLTHYTLIKHPYKWHGTLLMESVTIKLISSLCQNATNPLSSETKQDHSQEQILVVTMNCSWWTSTLSWVNKKKLKLNQLFITRRKNFIHL